MRADFETIEAQMDPGFEADMVNMLQNACAAMAMVATQLLIASAQHLGRRHARTARNRAGTLEISSGDAIKRAITNEI